MTTTYCPPFSPSPMCFLSLTLFPCILYVVIFIVARWCDTAWFPEIVPH